MGIKINRTARIRVAKSTSFVWMEQKNDSLCWAACIQMLLLPLRGMQKDQYEIVEQVKGLTRGSCAQTGCYYSLKPEEVKTAFEGLSLTSTPESNPLPKERLVNVLDHPVAVRCSGGTGDGHLLLVIAPAADDKFNVLDPWRDYATGCQTYQYLSSGHPRGPWEWTWFDIQ